MTKKREHCLKGRMCTYLKNLKEFVGLVCVIHVTQFSYTLQEQLSVLDSFTGSPLADDILLYAIPVCGPYSAMQNYKYVTSLLIVHGSI